MKDMGEIKTKFKWRITINEEKDSRRISLMKR